MLDTMLDELLLEVATCLDAPGLLDLQATCRRLRALPTDPCWAKLCEAEWQPRPRFRLTPARELWLRQNLPLTWRERYEWFQIDARRKVISVTELTTLRWWFNFTPAAGGRGESSRCEAHFTVTHLHVPGYPPLPIELISPPSSDQGTGASLPAAALSTLAAPLTSIQSWLQSLVLAPPPPPDAQPQQLKIANFPLHEVTRLDSWEWLIQNDNVTLVSCARDALPEFAGDF